MSRRKIIMSLAVPALLLVLGLAAWSWLLHTESGARWLFSRLNSSIPASLGSSGISGDLGSGLQLAGFWFEDPGTRIEVAHLTIAVDVDLLPPAIGIETLQADAVLVRTLGDSGQETDLEALIPGLALPIPLTFRAVDVSGFEYAGAGGDSVFTIQSITASGSMHSDLVLDQLAISLPGIRAAVQGRLGLSAPQPLALDFRVSGDLDLAGRAAGSLESANLTVDSGVPRLSIEGTLERLLRSPAWDLVISSPELQWPLDDAEPDVKFIDLWVQTSGEWQEFELELKGNLELDELESARMELLGSGSGAGSGFTARKLTLVGGDLSLKASGTVSWADDFHVALDATLDRLEPGKWLDDWPENRPVSGELALAWDGGELEISNFNLGVADTTLSASGHGVVDVRSGIVDGALDWNDFSWPPGDPAPMVVSRSGDILVSGQPEDWKLDGNVFLQAGDFPEGRLKMSGAGNLESFEVTIHEGAILGGTLSGNAGLNWTGSKPFDTELAIRGIDITPLLPRYGGVLNAQLSAGGSLEPFGLELDIQQLDGTILDHPVSARGGIRIEQERFQFNGLTLGSGASSVSLDGNPFDPDGIDFSADIDSLARFSKELGGAISARGTVSLHPGAPAFRATLRGQDLIAGPIGIARIETLESTGAGVDAGSELLFSGITIRQRPVESLSFRFGGERPLERITVNAQAEGARISMEFNGGVNDWSDPMASGWSGSLRDFRIDHGERFGLALDQETAVDLGPSHFNMEQACFSGRHGARICLESSWDGPDELRLSADLVEVPVGLLELFTDTDVLFTQVLSGTLKWSQEAGGRRSGSARIEISPGEVRDVDDGEVLLETGPGLFGFETNEGQLRQGVLALNIPRSGDIDFDFSLPDLSLGLESPVLGAARIDLSDIGALGLFIPMLDTIDGVLDVDLSLSGTVSDPAFKGRAALTGGRLENIASGFSFTDINLSGEVNEFDRSELKGSFRAGEGSGEIAMSIVFEDFLAPVVSLALEGEALTVIDVPELKVIANPDLSLNWQNKTLDINGRLFIPATRLSPSYLPQGSVRQSEDVVVVAGELPVAEEDFLTEKAASVQGSLELELGDEVVVDLNVAEIRVTGMTEFSWTGDLVPIGNGNFDLTGELQAFGQLLRLTQGRVGFPGTPADNPHLNIRAEREIFGNSQIRRAGVMIAGTLRRPVVEAYTVPMTNKERAQTLLVTGSDFNFEQGVGAVDVGMYVLPRLYISYGIGVFEDGNVLKARYDLGRGFGIRASSGQRETGLDISYTIER